MSYDQFSTFLKQGRPGLLAHALWIPLDWFHIWKVVMLWRIEMHAMSPFWFTKNVYFQVLFVIEVMGPSHVKLFGILVSPIPCKLYFHKASLCMPYCHCHFDSISFVRIMRIYYQYFSKYEGWLRICTGNAWWFASLSCNMFRYEAYIFILH